jgi:hypothetical protein
MRGISLISSAAVLVAAGCQYDGQYGQPPRMIAVNVNVHFPKAVGRAPLHRAVEVPYGSTVLDATIVALPDLYGRRHDGTTQSGYIDRMPYLMENEPTQRGGWTYTVNGSHPSPSPRGMPLMDGDQIEWTYNPM